MYAPQGKGNCTSAHERSRHDTWTGDELTGSHKDEWRFHFNPRSAQETHIVHLVQKYKKLFTCWEIRNWRLRQPADYTWYCKMRNSKLLLCFGEYHLAFSTWNHPILVEGEMLRTRLQNVPLPVPGRMYRGGQLWALWDLVMQLLVHMDKKEDASFCSRNSGINTQLKNWDGQHARDIHGLKVISRMRHCMKSAIHLMSCQEQYLKKSIGLNMLWGLGSDFLGSRGKSNQH